MTLGSWPLSHEGAVVLPIQEVLRVISTLETLALCSWTLSFPKPLTQALYLQWYLNCRQQKTIAEVFDMAASKLPPTSLA